MFRKWIVLLVGCALVGGCEKGDADFPAPTASGAKADHTGFHGTSHAIDILFVIDNSGSMAEEQLNLRKNFPALINTLRNEELGPDGSGLPCHAADQSGCEIPSVRIGVVSSDMGAGNYGLPSCEAVGGDGGKLSPWPRLAGCTGPIGHYISYDKGKSNVAGPGNEIQKVVDAFGCISALGTSGCGFEQQLESARTALSGANAGFLRHHALLAVVFITDEDDCSAANPALYDSTQSALSDPLGPLNSFRCFDFGVQCDINDRTILGDRQNCVPSTNGWMHDVKTRYVDFFRGLKHAGDVVVAAIAGPTTPVRVGTLSETPWLEASCKSMAGIASPAIRLKAVVDAFGTDGIFTSICEPDFGPPLKKLGQVLKQKL